LDSRPEHPQLAELVNACDLTVSALEITQRNLGSGKLHTTDGHSYRLWSNGTAIGYRCGGAGEKERFVYLAPVEEDGEATGAMLLCCGAHGDPDLDEILHQSRIANRTGGTVPEEPPESVTVELPWDGHLRLGAHEAARLVANAYGEKARQISISARRKAFTAYWDELARLLEQPRPVRKHTPTGA
jgi:hypothetical protein